MLAASTAALGLAGTRAAQAEQKPLTVSEWATQLGRPVDDHAYGVPSKFEAGVIRRRVDWLTATAESSVAFTPLAALEGIITPNGLGFIRDHGGTPDIDPAQHRLVIEGLVEKPLIFTLEDIKRFPRVNRIHFCECAANSAMENNGPQMQAVQYSHGMVHNAMYTGVLLKTLLEAVGLKPNAKYVMPEGGDASGLTRTIPLDKALDDCMIAYNMNGEALHPGHGYPMRLVVPGWQANMWVKWIRRIKVGDEPFMTHEETAKYTSLMKDGRSRMFTWPMDAKSVITSPAPEAPWMSKGQNVISGIAWSGRGTIKQVDVSLDGGKNWVKAQIEGPVLPFSMVRFYVNTDWNGDELLLQSRAHDNTGYVQPTKNMLRAIRGRSFNYHNNGIQTWQVRKIGEVNNVEVS
ncbi:MAG: sulfite dehydrogenase [Hyphomicrobiales bacterium]|nr:sulfite dehydrogenase [Hyphomicrobiales bacterium]MDE2114546.1 sulfite dehydrogenase [Hyphomicrobiales bacterium]